MVVFSPLPKQAVLIDCRKYVRMKWWLVIIILQCQIVSAQQRWDGEANNRLWSDGRNWEGDSIPDQNTQVIFDHTFIDSNFTVILDSAAGPVVIGSLEIIPSNGRNIRLIIPAQNKISPALNCLNAHSIVLRNGAIIQNSSGASSGSIILVSDSVYLFNGSRYIHNTARAHASFVSLLSARTGTEEGIFEFDVPSASTTVSLSDRVFGRLVFSSQSAGGSSNYTGSGTKPIKVRSGLELINGAKLNLNFTDTLHVSGDISLLKSTLNISSSVRSFTVKVQGNINGDEQSVITETGTAYGEVLLSGKQSQLINFKGLVSNEVGFKFDNSFDVTVQSHLSVPSKLVLKNGIINTTSSALLKLGKRGYFVCDTLNLGTFVNGPVYMESDSLRNNTLLPIGSGILHWIALKNWSGSFVVEYVKADPNQFGQVEILDHISTQGYWKFSSWLGSAQSLELSFPDVNFSGVTDLASLGGAILNQSKWTALQVKERKGSAGSNGSIVLGDLSWQPTTMFALGSYLASQNPLPLRVLERKKRVIGTGSIKILKAFRSGDNIYVEIDSKERGPLELAMFNIAGQLLVKRNINVMKGRQIISMRLPLHSPTIIHLFGLFYGVPVNSMQVML